MIVEESHYFSGGSTSNIISYKDMYNWDVRGDIIENFLCRYIEQNTLCVTLKVIEKLEDCAAKNKSAEFHIWLKDGDYSRYIRCCNFSVPIHFVKSILENFYFRLEKVSYNFQQEYCNHLGWCN